MKKYNFTTKESPSLLKGIDSKGGDVLEVKGMIAEVGTFHPSDGSVVIFDKNSIRVLFDSIDGNLKLWMNHVGTACGRVAFGWATKFALTNDDTRIVYEGWVFEDVDQKDIKTTSNESMLTLDENGVVVDGKFTGIAFVLNPAMPNATVDSRRVNMSETDTDAGTETSEVKVVLDAVTTSDFSIEEPISKTITAGDTVISDPSNKVGETEETTEFNMGNTETIPEGMTIEQEKHLFGLLKDKYFEAEIVSDVATLTEKVDTLTAESVAFEATIVEQKSIIETQGAFISEVKKAEFTGIVNKLKEFGMAEPEKIVADVDVEKGTAILEKMFETLAVTKNIPDTKTETSPNTEAKNFASASDAERDAKIKEMGLSNFLGDK